MRDILRDLVKNVRAADIGTVKIVGEDGKITFQGVDEKRTVIMKGNIIKDEPELEGVSGIGNLDSLAATLNVFGDATDTVTIARKPRKVRIEKKDENGEAVLDVAGNPEFEEVEEDAIEKFVFNKTKPFKMEKNFRIIARNLIPNQYSPKAVDYQVEFTPTAAAIEYLDKMVSIANSDVFSVKIAPGTNGNNSLFINLGEVGNESTIEFHQDVAGELKNTWYWDISQTLKLLKLSTSSTLTVGFSDRGMLKISVVTGIANYEFTIPPRQQ